jgi:class 3 adenylate cyclase
MSQNHTRVGVTEAEALCRRAIAISPDYAQAHSLLAWILVQRISRFVGDVVAVLPEALAEARAAISLDERDAWAHMTLGVVLWRMRGGGEAERAYRRALELNPNFAIAHANLALTLAIHGSHQEAIEAAAHALRLSPNDLLVGVFASVAMAAAYFAAERYTDAMAWARNTIERSPEHPPAHFLLVAAAAMQGDLPAVVEALGALLCVVPHLSLAWMRRNTAYVGEVGDRLLEGLRRAGLPDETAKSERVLATVLFTDIVDSTRRTAEIGDRGWSLVLDRHDAAIREELARFRGREVKTLGDGFLATFDSPARAVRCAEAILGRMQPLGIAVRAGLHTGEVELRRDEVGGIAVHIAARIAELAGGGEILVSATVRDLVAGSGLGFLDRGSHALKGLPEPLRLYAAG